MDTRPLRILLTANTAVFLVICAVFLVHYVGAGVFPDGMDSWLEDHRWLMWTAAALAVASALTLPLLRVTSRQRGGDR